MQQTTSQEIRGRFCVNCGEKMEAGHNFCSSCGARAGGTARKSLKGSQIATLAVVGLTLWGVAWSIQSSLGGKAPTKTFEQSQSGAGESNPHGGVNSAPDPEIEKLRAAAEAAPKDKEAWRALGGALTAKISQAEKPPSELIFDALAVLRHILDIDPKDDDALLGMADISFNQQAFSKAADFYKRFLEINPNEADIRARYASSLTFMGKFDDSIAELKKALEIDPKNFHASAYLAVTYAEKGDMKTAMEVGEEVLKKAPNEEARARFADFLDSIKNKPQGKPAAQVAEKGPQPENVRGTLSPVEEYIRNHPIAGSKFARAESPSADKLVLYFNNFPMEQMPPFVKDKFLTSIKDKMAGDLKTVLFVDEASKNEMAKIER